MGTTSRRENATRQNAPMPRVLFTASADADAAAIFSYLRIKAGKPTAIKYRALFKRLYEQLADFPDSGTPRDNLGTDIRIGVVAPYIVIYRHIGTDNTVIVYRIVPVAATSRRRFSNVLNGVFGKRCYPATACLASSCSASCHEKVFGFVRGFCP